MDNRVAGRKRMPTPVRTCVGCRDQAAKSNLLRVAVVGGSSLASPALLAPDPDDRLPGRGAYIHYSLGCFDLAERRRAFPRALRHAGALDARFVREWLTEQTGAPV